MNDTIVASFEADLTGLEGGAAVVFASGFLTPDTNQGGMPLGLFAALPGGDVVALPPVTAERAEELADLVAMPDEATALAQNSPNPFSPSTQIAFSLPEPTQVALRVYNVRGQVVRSLVDERLDAGRYDVTFDGSGLASGIYYYRLDAGAFSEIRKMTLLK